MLQQPVKQPFEDDIIVVVIGIMRKTKRISEIQWQIFDILPCLQQKQENSLQGLLKLANSYILYEPGRFHSHPNSLVTLISMASEALYAKKNQKIKESFNSEGAILLQLLLQSFPGFLDNYLEKILSLVIDRYTNTPIQNPFLKVRLLGVVLAALSYNFDQTTAILLRNMASSGITLMRFVLIEIIQLHGCFKHPYDKKVAVLGLAQIFTQTSLHTDISELANHLFEGIILIITAKPPEVTEAKGKLDKLLDKLMDHEMDDLTDSEIMVRGTKLMFGDNNTEATEETEASLAVTQLMSPLNTLDEIAFFKDLLHGLQQRNPNGIKAIIAALSEDRRKDLMEIVRSQRVKINDFPGDNTVVRKIVKARHR